MTMKKTVLISMLALAGMAGAEVLDPDRPGGIHIGQRMTIRPYVAMAYTWDSNVYGRHDAGNGSSAWSINPGAGFEYRADNWSLTGDVYYRYMAYLEDHKDLDNSSWGENLNYRYSSSAADEQGWTLLLSESYALINQGDDMLASEGRGVGRDRQQLNVSAVAERRFNERLHAGVVGGYYMLDYKNQATGSQMYGWDRWNLGAEVGWMASRWTDLLLSGGYAAYNQDNGGHTINGRRIGGSSDSWNVLIGMGSRATERISYRVMGGLSHFEYGDGVGSDNGFIYQMSANWKASDTLDVMALASSHYQPSEREDGAALKVYSASIGAGKSLVRGKLRTTLDFCYRHEDRVYTAIGGDDYTEDIITGRLGVNYTLNRFVGFFGNLEYQSSMLSGDSRVVNDRDYDRWRATVGMRLTY